MQYVIMAFYGLVLIGIMFLGIFNFIYTRETYKAGYQLGIGFPGIIKKMLLANVLLSIAAALLVILFIFIGR